MASAKAEDFSALRAYVFDYVCGIIWLLAALAVWLSFPTSPQLQSLFDGFARALGSFKGPDLVQGFLLVILGVAVPYSFSVILRPITLRVMSFGLKRQRGFQRLLKGFTKALGGSSSYSLESTANEQVRSQLELPEGIKINRELRLLFVQARHSSVGTILTKWQEEVFFRASVVLPSSLLLGAVVHGLWPNSPIYTFLAAVIGFFFLGTWFINREFDSLMDALCFGVMLSSKYPLPEEHGGSGNEPKTRTPLRRSYR